MQFFKHLCCIEWVIRPKGGLWGESGAGSRLFFPADVELTASDYINRVADFHICVIMVFNSCKH